MLFRILFVLTAVFLALLIGLYNRDALITLVPVDSPLGGDRVYLYFLLFGAMALGAGVSGLYVYMNALFDRHRMALRERDLRGRLQEKDKTIHEVQQRVNAAEERLSDYESKVREFTLQVMQISHALAAPSNSVEPTALPELRTPGEAGTNRPAT